MTDTRMKTKRWIPVLLGVLVIAFIAVGLYLAARPQAPQIQGMVDADTFTVATKAPSRIEALLAKEGQEVARGQVLARLSSPEISARDQQANAVLQGAQAVSQMSQEGARAEDIRSVQAVWQAAQAAANLAAQTSRRAENLFAQGVISAQRRDEALAARLASAAQAEAAHQQYLKLAAGLRAEEKAVADAQVEVARAGVAETASLKEETQLLSPIAGEIAERFANQGELVLIGIPVFTVIDIEHAYVIFSVREDQFAGLKQGSIVNAAIPALELTDVGLLVEHISPQADFATWRATRQSSGYDVRSFEIRARPAKPIEGLRPGMSVMIDWPAPR